MGWGRNTSGGSSKNADGATIMSTSSPVSTTVLPLDEAQQRAHDATQAIRDGVINLKTPKQNSGAGGVRKRAHSFSLSFFNAQRATAKQESQRQRKTGESSQVIRPPLPTTRLSPTLDGGHTLRFFPIRKQSRAALNDMDKTAKGVIVSTDVCVGAPASRKQSMAVEDDDEFGCCGLSDAAFRTLLTASSLRDSDGGHHRSENSTSSTSSSNSSTTTTTRTETTTSRGRASGEEIDSNTSAASGTSRADVSFETKRESVDVAAAAAESEKAEVDVDSIDVSDLLDSTLMPAVMSPTTLNAPELTKVARHAISMPSLRAQFLNAVTTDGAEEAENESGRLTVSRSPSPLLDSPATETLLMPFIGDLNALRLQLGPAMGTKLTTTNRFTPVPTTIEEHTTPSLPARSPLRARRQKEPLTIEAVSLLSPSPPSITSTPALVSDENSPLSPTRAAATFTSPPFKCSSPTTPSSSTTTNGLGLALLRARRSKSSLKLAALTGNAALNVNGPLSPPPCPPPATPLPQLPPSAIPDGRSSTASDATDISVAPQISLETQNPDFFVFGFAF